MSSHPDLNFITGSVTIRDYDLAVMSHIGAVVENINLTGRSIPTYVLRVDGVSDPIFCVLNDPSSEFVKSRVPSISVMSEAPEEAVERFGSVGALAQSYFDPVTEKMVERLLPVPHDFRYTLNCKLKSRHEYNALMMYLLKRIKRNGTIGVKDSLDAVRRYLYVKEGLSNITEVIDTAERYPAFSISILVKGELELTSETKFFTVKQDSGVIINVEKKKD